MYFYSIKLHTLWAAKCWHGRNLDALAFSPATTNSIPCKLRPYYSLWAR